MRNCCVGRSKMVDSQQSHMVQCDLVRNDSFNFLSTYYVLGAVIHLLQKLTAHWRCLFLIKSYLPHTHVGNRVFVSVCLKGSWCVTLKLLLPISCPTRNSRAAGLALQPGFAAAVVTQQERPQVPWVPLPLILFLTLTQISHMHKKIEGEGYSRDGRRAPSGASLPGATSGPAICSVYDRVKWKSLTHVQLFVTSPGKNTGVDCLSLLQGTFLTQGLNLGLLHCRQILHHLSHQGSPCCVCDCDQLLTLII